MTATASARPGVSTTTTLLLVLDDHARPALGR
jgi:hypothetical protein